MAEKSFPADNDVRDVLFGVVALSAVRALNATELITFPMEAIGRRNSAEL